MSTTPEPELDLELQLLPAWAKQSPDVNRYAKYEGGGEDRERGGRGGGRDRFDRGNRGERRDRPPRRDGQTAGRPGGRPSGGDRGDRGGRPGPRRERSGGRRGDRPRFEEERDAPPLLPELNVAILPEEKGVESLARQIKLTGRAYPMFDIAHLILKKPERYHVTFSVVKKADQKVAQPLFICTLDNTVWLSEAELAGHVLEKHFATFYQVEKTAAEPPKGTYAFVAQCGMSGVVLGPPNHHDYQAQLRRLHAERFSRMPFDAFKARVKIVREEAVIKKWLEDQSWKTEYVCLNVSEPRKLGSRDEVERHFRQTHLAGLIKSVESHTLGGAECLNFPLPAFRQLARRAWEEQTRFPIKVVTVLSQQFAALGLQFFKVNKTVTHVSVARPHFLDVTTTPVSDGIKRIIDFIDATPKCTRRKILESLAPVPAAANPPETNAAPAGAEPTPPPVVATPSPEQAAVVADLHWLIHQGHVIEFANGLVETAKRPLPRPTKPSKPEAKASEPSVAADPSSVEAEAVPASPETPAAEQSPPPA